MQNFQHHRVVSMTRELANEIATWEYKEPFTFYNGEGDADTVNELLNGDYRAVLDPVSGICVGFFCFGPSAQVPSGHDAGVYHQEHLDIGLGLHPDQVGQGNGLAFLQAALHYGRVTCQKTSFRLTVATFNRPAIRVYEKAGFEMISLFYHPVENGLIEFITMEYESSS
ncbi:GNAT family N-acetyltransferase [Salisediminibacterium beveridgei]|uniref:GCN5-Related N-Acetyltransferase n=1 Tax=Salisediminibacterium beveridgei TaxID=632773 RepID=A0A1D7QYC1_9BACI|nr:GNAT family N-acetyltransferase [Salisediminibacterium beveridgei]AOM84001.1 GCN5-Related N-Acetyltransferase [Salisediminibacterium beveridgei]